MYAELSYLVDSVFKGHWYAMFIFLFIETLLLIVVIGLLSVISTYMQLCY
jgi:hypothetical protein